MVVNGGCRPVLTSLQTPESGSKFAKDAVWMSFRAFLGDPLATNTLETNSMEIR